MNERDAAPALGTSGAPAEYRRAFPGAAVELARRAWEDARWSDLFRAATNYAAERPRPGQVEAAARRMRTEPSDHVQGPIVKPAVWTWEVPLYFWFGGIAAGSSFVGLACDLAGDERSAATARKVALGALAPCPVLLIADLGRPARFLYMLRIFKPRSPMSMGTWCLTSFGGLGTAAVGSDLLGRRRTARRLGAATAVVGGYLGSYTGVLLSTTAVPLWARSRLFLGPIFVATATATGAAATRLVLRATGVAPGHQTLAALRTVETGAMLAELTLSSVNERRIGRLASALHRGRAGRLYRGAQAAVAAGLALRFLHGRFGARAYDAASVLYLIAGLGFRYAWVTAGRASASDDEAVALMARLGHGRREGQRELRRRRT